MKIITRPERPSWAELCRRPEFDTELLTQQVSQILEAVKKDQDQAVRSYTKTFDGVDIDILKVGEEEFTEASQLVAEDLKAAIEIARCNIASFHRHQREEVRKIETMPGVVCWRKSVAIEKVGLYVPGGSAPLFSTVLMLGVPAVLAGCSEVVLCTPPGKNGKVHPAILYAAQRAGITSVFKVGGAQAIAAMAFGTETIPQVYKILGPGNQYVTRAKQLVNINGIAIDMPAGPSEVLICADDNADPGFIAADLLSQAEHGADSQVVLVAFDRSIVDQTLEKLKEQTDQLPRSEIAKAALENSLAIIVDSPGEALDFINTYAPEHLILAMDEAESFSEGIINAGSVFLGHLTPESVGDYASGTNHTLPTGGFAKAYSGVSLDTFLKKITFQHLSPAGLRNIGPAVEKMAAAEQLDAHKNAVTIRLKSQENGN